jgi:hypothetical protein
VIGGKGGGLFQAAPPANPLRARGPRGPGRLSRGGAEVLFADVFLGCERSGRPVPGERPRAWGGVRAAARRVEPPILRGTIVRLPRPCSVPKGKPVDPPCGGNPRGFPQHGRSSKPKLPVPRPRARPVLFRRKRSGAGAGPAVLASWLRVKAFASRIGTSHTTAGPSEDGPQMFARLHCFSYLAAALAGRSNEESERRVR